MYKNRKNHLARIITLGIAVTIFVTSCIRNSLISEISLIPEPSIGNGIYRIKGDDLTGNLIWSPNGQYLAGLNSVGPNPDFCFLGCEESYFEIYIIDLENKQRQTILRTKYSEKDILNIFWFPDGLHIGYTTLNDLEHGGETWSIDIQGQNDIQVLSEIENPVWSPDNTKKALDAFEKFGNDWYSVIYVVDALTNQKDQVFIANEPYVHLRGLSWSLDGKILAFSYGDTRSDVTELRPKIFFVELETNKITQFTINKFEEFTHPEFSPKYNLIAYERYQPAFNKRTVVIEDLNAKCEIQLPNEFNSLASWSPDGQKLTVGDIGKYYVVDLLEFIGPKFKETGSICT